MDGLWPLGLSRWRRTALLVVDGLALWLTALLLDLYNDPATWNVAGSTPREVAEMAVMTTVRLLLQPSIDLPGVLVYFGLFLVLIGAGWYGLLRPVVEKHTEMIGPLSDPVDDSKTP